MTTNIIISINNDNKNIKFETDNEKEFADTLREKINKWVLEDSVFAIIGFGNTLIDISLQDMRHIRYMKIMHDKQMYTYIKSLYAIRLDDWLDYIVKFYKIESEKEKQNE